MSELLLELFSEEIPARLQRAAAGDLQRLLGDALRQEGLEFEDSQADVTPRRLVLVVRGLPKKTPDLKEQRKGPRLGAPEKAIEGFLRGSGLTSLDQAKIHEDPKKGAYYIAEIEKKGRPASTVIGELIPSLIHSFPWKKSMRWGSGPLKWVRPLHRILCLFDDKIVDFEVAGLRAGNVTSGHRFMAAKNFKVKNAADYYSKLEKAYVLASADDRRVRISGEAQKLARDHKLTWVEDGDLLAENTGLVEWPRVLMGSFDKDFLKLPEWVLMTAMKKHQKCFSLRRGKKLSNHFLMVSNLEAQDGGAAIRKGNERVICARLSDAKFFFEQDLKINLEDRLTKLETIVFHEKLGTQAERVARLEALSGHIARSLGYDPEKASRAARLLKADLTTDMVGEFANLQGYMGGVYAAHQGESREVSEAIEDHYKPQGAGDSCPKAETTIAVALADKIDMLVGFWAIDEKPTGSRDPYALRRAALGVLRIILENKVRLKLDDLHHYTASLHNKAQWSLEKTKDLRAFFADRLKIHLRDQGARHDLIDAVFSLSGQDDLLKVARRVDALGCFLATEEGGNLLAGVKRAQNILRIEEKKEKSSFEDQASAKLFALPQEKNLHKAIDEVRKKAEQAVEQEDFQAAMSALAALRVPIDDFFQSVTVNTDDQELRKNRLNLLSEIRRATLEVADFERIEG